MKLLLSLTILALLVGFGCVLPSACGGAVCGSDWQTYQDRCTAEKAGVQVFKEGECGLACNDSDVENDVSLFGTVDYHGILYVDYCQQGSLVQYSCAGDTLLNETTICSSGECNAGVCLSEGCFDSDGGKVQNEKGEASMGSTTYEDFCASERQVQEYYCLSGMVSSKVITCSSGYVCDNGECVETNCVDTEPGQGEFTSGTVTKNGINYTDYCTSSGQIYEFYCDGNDLRSTTVYCPEDYVCSSGKCVSNLCTDTDNGADKYTVGNVTKAAIIYTDYCYDSDSVKEYYCSSDEVYYDTIECPSGYRCDEGKCKVTSMCDESDDGDDEYEKGTTTYEGSYTDYCYDSETVLEYFCDGDYSVDHDEIDCSSGYECEDGQCVPSDECDETDDGEDEYEKGTTTYNGESQSDSCYDGNTVLEYFCDGSHSMDDTTIDCLEDYVCVDGECVEVSCTDSDDGEDYGTAGTVTYSEGDDDETYSDDCLDDYILNEWYCDGYYPMNVTYNCSSGCSADACLD